MPDFTPTTTRPDVARGLLPIALVGVGLTAFGLPAALAAWVPGLPGAWATAIGALATALVLGGVARRLSRWLPRQGSASSMDRESLALMAGHTGLAVVVTDADRRIVWTNDAFTRLTGYAAHEVLGRRPGALLQSERTDRATIDRMAAALDAGHGVRVELLNRSKDGRDYWIDTDIQPLRDADGRISGFLAVQTDVTDRVTERLRTEAVFANLPTGVVMHGVDGAIVEANPAARALLGLDRPASDRDGPWHEDLRPMAADETAVARTLASGRGQLDQVMGVAGPDGQRRWLLASAQPLRDALGDPAGVVACYIDITERRRLTEQLRQSARTDGLTQLPNRAVVLERVQRALEHRRRHPGYEFAVLFMDIDRFKQVNDTLGHGAGDELLRQVAQRLELTLRPGDAIGRIESELQTAARLGGDEFVIVLEGLRAAEDACTIAQRLLDELGQPYTVAAHPVHVGVSIGIVGAAHAGDSADAVLRDCDIAMYEAKRAGRARFAVFDASMHERVVGALAIERDLRQALQGDELFAVYQPVIDLASGALAGVEALVRWQHPQRGVVTPSQFITVAEESGLIDALGDVMLRKACEQFATWSRELGRDAPPRVSVNLSRSQLKLPGLVAEVRELLRTHGMQPGQLQLEVTESLAAQDDQIQATLRELKTLGVGLALDDFGTGYSSLACLHQMPVDTVKIDRSFVAHAEDVEYHRVLIEATIRVARTLGMRTVAEGIELDAQSALMHELGCDLGQGYLFGRPMAAGQFAAWLEAQRADTVT